MTNWKTNLGGAVGTLGTTLIGVGVLGGANVKYQAVCWWVALVGFIISALGKSLTALFAADATTVNNIAKAVDTINQTGPSSDTTMLAKPQPQPATAPQPPKP